MGRYYYNKKEEADSLKKIQTWFLKKHGYFDMGWKSGTVTWTNGWSGNKSSISVESQIFGNESFIRLIYSQTNRDTGEQQNFNCKIPLTTTKCYFGGERFWFECSVYKSGVYCGRRVGVLYKAGDYFACRHCYNLSYESRNENRRFRDYGMFRVLRNGFKIEELEKQIKRKYYNGKPTKKQKVLNNFLMREIPRIQNLNIYKRKVLTK